MAGRATTRARLLAELGGRREAALKARVSLLGEEIRADEALLVALRGRLEFLERNARIVALGGVPLELIVEDW